MRVLRVGFVGLRTADVDAMRWFFQDLLGLEPVRMAEGVATSRLPGRELEVIGVFADAYRDDRHIPNDVDFMIAFVVEDLDEALAEVKAAGLRVVVPGPEVVWTADEFDRPAGENKGWFFVRAPDRRVYAFMQVPD